MSPDVSEEAFERAIECQLLHGGPDECSSSARGVAETALSPWGYAPGGYRKRTPEEYDRTICLLPRGTLDFILATQPTEWNRLKQHHGAEVKDRFLARLSQEIERRGALDVLRRGIKDSGCKFNLACFRPSSGLNEELERLYAANMFGVVRQLHYSEKNENSLDLGLFLNGIPVFTAELKNPLTGQTVEHAMVQYKRDRDPREPLFKFGRCLAHFAVDPDLVYVTTKLAGPATRFLPLNKGKYGGAGNPPVMEGYATAYLWEDIWSRDGVLNLVRQFVHEVEDESKKGKKPKKSIIFPRYHQLDAVRRLIAHARSFGAGQQYLIQHSAGSGKSFTIAWLAHQLSILHDNQDKRVFDSIVVITDRRVLDRQLQGTVRQFEQTLGVVENIDTTSRQLKAALESGKTIIVTTLQKFPVIADEIGQLAGKRFAVIVDEAHSSQSGETTKSMKSVLAADSLEAAEAQEAGGVEDLEDRIVAEMKKRGRLPNVSTFAFTATPKPKTLELFGVPRDDGKFEPFSLYSMRQAIEEGFILDVLENYTTYNVYWNLLKTIKDDPRYDKKKAAYLLRKFVDLHEHAIRQKVAIMVEHFAGQVAHRIKGRAKVMIVTRSRLHAVRFKLALDQYIKEKGYPYKALVAFSGTVHDEGKDYTEPNMNGFSETQTALTFGLPEYRFLVCAEKFQTGFDQPLLHTMYVDKKLGGVNAVQTLSRLNRVSSDKTETMVLDFANDADEIQEAFQPYYERAVLSECTDPNLLYNLTQELLEFAIYAEANVETFARLYFNEKTTQDLLYRELEPIIERFKTLTDDDQADCRGKLSDYVRLYSFLSQVLTFVDADLEKLYVFARLLRRYLPKRKEELPREIQRNIDMESYRISKARSGKIGLERGNGEVVPQAPKGPYHAPEEEIEPLSLIIEELNKRFGADLTDEDRMTIGRVLTSLQQDPALDAAARVNRRENVRLTFDHKLEDVMQQILDSNFKLYKRVTDDESFGRALADHLFDRYLRSHREIPDLIKKGESKTLEFKSTLRWNIREGKKDPKVATHAVLKTIAAFLNTEGGDLLIGVADDGAILGIQQDDFENDDKFALHVTHVVQAALGDRASTCIDPRVQLVDGKSVCLVSSDRSPEPVYFKWKGTETNPEGDFFARSGPGTVKLDPENAKEYVRTRWG